MLGSTERTRGRKSRTKLYALAAITAALVMNSLSGARFAVLRSGYQVLVSPVRTPLLWIRDIFTRAHRIIAENQRLLTENNELKALVGRLKRQLESLREIRAQNERLNRLLDFKNKERQYEFTVAEIIGRDPHPLRRSLLLDKGALEGIHNDDPVLLPEGVIGRIVEVYRSTSRVMLLQDRQSSIGAMIQKTRATGDAAGVGSELLVIRNIPPESSVEPGDLVITSGMSTFYPKGLTIGTIVELCRDPKRLYQKILVRPNADAFRCEEVLVLKRQKSS